MTTFPLRLAQYYLHENDETGYFNVISKNPDEFTYERQGVLRTHSYTDCIGDHHCAIHNNASLHPLAWAPLIWDEDLKTLFRVCEHDHLHPDYDSATWLQSKGDWHKNIHTCDGCCGKGKE